MRLLIIDNTLDPDSWGSSNLARFGRLSSGSTVTVRRAPHDDLPSNPSVYDKVILSGSRTSCLEDAPWISRLDAFVRDWIGSGKPLLGVCYGHQALVRAMAGKTHVRKAAEPEFGWTRIEVLEGSPLLEHVPREFHSFSSHYEEVAELPAGFRRLARSRDCEIQACQLGDRPVFGIQFHPEKDLNEGERILSDKKKAGAPKKLLGLGQGKTLFDASIGETIFGNFLRL